MAIDLTSNIISWWRLDETSGVDVVDTQDNHNGTTADNISTITSIDAPDGRSSSFDINGDDDKNVTILDSNDFTFVDEDGDLPFSLSTWFKMVGPGTNFLISKYDAGLSQREYYFYTTSTALALYMQDESSNGYLVSFHALPLSLIDGKWHHAVATYSGLGGALAHTGIRCYLDGVELTTTTSFNANNYNKMVNTSSSLTLGGSDDAFGNFKGLLSDAMVFDRVLTDGEVKYFYNDGFGVESGALAIIDPISSPTLTFPNGGETFTEGDINIQWAEPGDLLSTELIWYEIFITDDFNKTKKEELIQIATIPSGNTSYNYTIQKNLRGEKCRVGIRSVNHRGLRSNVSFSADDFIIDNEVLPSPSLLEPVIGGTYFSYILFVFDHQGVSGRSSQRSFYQIYYKSDNQDIDWTLLQGNIMVGADPMNIDVSNFNTDSDYVFKIELVDDNNVSAPVFIDNININNINVFLIDTESPTGSIKIVDDNEYTKNTGLILQISSSDEVSTTKDIQIQQTNVETGNVTEGSFIPLTSLITWDIKEEVEGEGVVDGVKLIQARFRDHGDNTLQTTTQKNFRIYKNLDNREVTTFLYGSKGSESNLYYAFASDESSSILAELYKDLIFISTLTGDCTSLEIYNNVLYIGIKDDENKGILQRLTTTVETVADNNQEFTDVAETVVNSLYSADSVINVMEVFDNTLFLGLDNGELLSFKGSAIRSENSDFLNLKSIRNVKTDGIMLYIFFYNTTEILIMRKDAGGNYVFSTVDTEG